MKIALVCGHFIPEMGYIEVYITKELANLGHEVKVFTSNIVPTYVRKIIDKTYPLGESSHPEFNYKILRLKPLFSIGQMLRVKGLKKEVDKYNPELILIIGVGKLFPVSLYSKNQKKYKIYTLIGNSTDNQKNDTSFFSRENITKLIKRSAYIKAIKYSTKLLPYTPESNELVKKFVPKNLYSIMDDKSFEISLGFDPDKFSFENSLRISGRKKLNVVDETPILITTTRIIPHKKLESIIDLIDNMNSNNISIYYVIIGFLDNEYGIEVKNYIQSKVNFNKFICFPYLKHEETKELYAAADIGYFPTAVISIFEAMGMGLPLILPKQKNVSHILDDSTSGFYASNDTIKDAFEKAYNLVTSSKFNRNNLITQNQNKFSYQSIVKNILKEVDTTNEF